MEKTISVVIVTYNSLDLIEECIKSLFKYNDIGNDLEIIVVDNSSEIVSNKMFDFIKLKFGDDIKLIHNPKNGGYGAGNNLGILNSSGKYICIMNPDVRLIEPVFKEAIFKFKKNTNLAMLGMKQIGGQNLSVYFRPEKYLPFFNIFTKIFNKLNIYLKSKMFLSGAFVFLRKEDIIEIGLYDENIFLYNEEADITNRFLNNSKNILFYPTLRYLHEIGDRSEISDFSQNIWLDSRVYYFNKFSFNLNSYLNILLIELKLKIIYFSLINNKDQVKVNKVLLEKIKNLYTRK